MALGSVLVSPTIISEKKTPIERTMPVFKKAAWIPAAPPRWSAGTEFMTAAEFGAENMPPPTPLAKTSAANAQYEKLVGRKRRPTKLRAKTLSPVVERMRAP